MILVKIVQFFIKIPCFFGKHKDPKEWLYCDVDTWDEYHHYTCSRCNKDIKEEIPESDNLECVDCGSNEVFIACPDRCYRCYMENERPSRDG
jgi:DNA-directed RNA polymerase subunit RPC12/RpoP